MNLVICDPRKHKLEKVGKEELGFLKQDVNVCTVCHLVFYLPEGS
jgi:hypothetical protein